jgi:hypothetical protein
VLADIAVDARGALDELRGVLGVLRRTEDGAPERSPQPELADVATLVQSARRAGDQVELDGDLAAHVGARRGTSPTGSSRRRSPTRVVTRRGGPSA